MRVRVEADGSSSVRSREHGFLHAACCFHSFGKVRSTCCMIVLGALCEAAHAMLACEHAMITGSLDPRF